MGDEQQLLILIVTVIILILLLIASVVFSRNKLGLIDLVVVSVIKMTTRSHIVCSYTNYHSYSEWEVVALTLDSYQLDSGIEDITLSRLRDILERQMLDAIRYANEHGYSGSKERRDSKIIHEWLNNLDKIANLTPLNPTTYRISISVLVNTIRNGIEETK